MEVEEAFDVTLPDDSPNPVFKAVFTRQPLPARRPRRTGLPRRRGRERPTGRRGGERGAAVAADRRPVHPTRRAMGAAGGLTNVRRSSRWRPPGRCRSTAGGPTACGACWSPRRPSRSGATRPTHPPTNSPDTSSRSTPFLIDAEPVSTTAYCRFLNSVGDVAPDVLADWFVLDPDDDRNEHMLVDERIGVASAAGHRAVADDPRLVVRGERLLALGQRAGLARATGARAVPSPRACCRPRPSGSTPPEGPPTGRSRGGRSTLAGPDAVRPAS